MSRRVSYVLLITLLSACCARAADHFKVIANPMVQISDISIDDLRSIFLGSRTSLKGGGPVHPVLCREGSDLSQFSTEYLGKSPAALETFYRSQVFTGRWSMPVAFGSDALVVDYVAKTPGAIAYVRDSTPTGRVKVLRIR